jgi:hypothetical protein
VTITADSNTKAGLFDLRLETIMSPDNTKFGGDTFYVEIQPNYPPFFKALSASD